jgi:hypothetical protein
VGIESTADLEVRAESLFRYGALAFLTALLPIGGVILLLNVESFLASPGLVAVEVGTVVVMSTFIAALLGWQSFSRSIIVSPQGVRVRVKSSRAQLWPWTELEPPDLVSFGRLWGMYALVHNAGPNSSDWVYLTKGQLRAVATCPYRPGWKLSANVQRVLTRTAPDSLPSDGPPASRME